MIGIYKITNTIDNKCYIGQSVDIKARWRSHKYEAQTGESQLPLYAALREYGIDAFKFEVLEKCSLKQEILDEREHYWIEYYNSYNNGYNSTLGGQSEGIPVYQYDLNGNYVDEYESISEAARKLGYGRSTICAVLNHERQTAYGFQWSKEKVESMPIVPRWNGKLVRCINTNQIFHSTGEAARWCNLKSHSGVQACCTGNRKTAGKHPQTDEPLKWEYVE